MKPCNGTASCGLPSILLGRPSGWTGAITNVVEVHGPEAVPSEYGSAGGGRFHLTGAQLERLRSGLSPVAAASVLCCFVLPAPSLGVPLPS
jgi:hypothetical protein